MKHHLLILASAVVLAASQGAGAQQMFQNTGGAAGDWEFRIGPVFQESKSIDFKGGSTAKLDSTTGFKIGTGVYVTNQLIVGGNFSYGQSNFNGTVNSGTPGISASIENGHVDFSTLMFDATRSFAIDVDYQYTWIDLSNTSSTPGFGAVELLFIWRFPAYH